MKKREIVTVLICDGCGIEEIQRKNDDPVQGIHVKFQWDYQLGGVSGTIWACSPECVIKGMENYDH